MLYISKLLLIFFFYDCALALLSDSFFSIIGPRSLIHGEDYVAYLISTNYSHPVNLEVKLFSVKPKKDIFKKIYRLPTLGEEIRVNLKGQRSSQEGYIITAGIPEVNTFTSTKIFTVERKYSVLIQTDKSTYKAGDKVKFRVLVIDVHTKPYDCQSVNVVVNDANQNNVYQVKLSNSLNGVYEGSLELSNDPLLGAWTISVNIDDSEVFTKKSFDVSKYSLPRFEAVIETKPVILLKDQVLKMEIFSKYTFNNAFVKGKASLTIKVYDKLNKPPVKELSKVLSPISKKEKIELKLQEDLKLEDAQRSFVKVSLVYVEDLTNKAVTSEKIVRVDGGNEKKFNIERNKKFKPGLPYKVKMILKGKNKEIVESNNKNLTLTVIYYNKLEETNTALCILNAKSTKNDVYTLGVTKHYSSEIKDGEVDFEVETFKDNNALFLSFDYKESTQSVNVFRAPSRSREYIAASIRRDNENIQENQKISVDVLANTEELNSIHAFVIGRTGITFKKSFVVSNSSFFTFEFTTNAEMLPESTLFVYFFQFSGEIIFDKVPLKFTKKLPNELKIKIKQKEVQPGENVTLNFESTANSFVFINGVDLGTTILKSGNEIDRSTIFSSFVETYKHQESEEDKKKFGRYPEFFDSNAFIITDAAYGNPSDCAFVTRAERDMKAEIVYLEPEEILTLPADTSDYRKDFSDTWLFEGFEVDDKGKLQIDRKAPDSVSTWLVSGFAINSNGIGFATPQRFKTTKNFYIHVEVPYSVKLGEIVKIDVYVSNYIEESQKLTVNLQLMKDENKFELVQVVGQKCKVTKLPDNHMHKSTEVPFDSVSLTTYKIRPTSTGDIKIRVLADSYKGDDKVEKTLKVYEGVSHYHTKTYLADLRYRKFSSYYFRLGVDREQAFKESVKIGASAFGNILGPLFHPNLPQLNMAKFISSIFYLQYLQSTKTLTAEKKSELLSELNFGYQDLIKLKKSDGSFGNLWYTSFVLKCLAHVKSWIEIDDGHIVDALKFIDKQQKNSGEFRESDNASEVMELTAFVTVSILENEAYVERFKTIIEESNNFLRNNINKVTNNYDLALICYAFALKKSSHAAGLLSQLTRTSINDDDEMFWNLNMNDKKRDNTTTTNISLKIDIASYALLAYLKADKKDEARKVLKWLVKYRTGALVKTEDTVILQAFTEAAKVFYAPEFIADIYFTDDFEEYKNIFINGENALDSHHVSLNPLTDGISVNANGTGIATLDFWWSYNTRLNKTENKFKVDVKVNSKTEGLLHLKICTSFIPDDEQIQSSLTIMEVSLPSGYEYDSDYKEKLQKTGEKANFMKFEPRENKTKILIYFESITSKEVCIEVQAVLKNKVEGLKDASVKVFEFYKPEFMGVTYYRPNGANCN